MFLLDFLLLHNQYVNEPKHPIFAKYHEPILLNHLSPFSYMADINHSNAAEQCWIWKNDGQEYFYDKHEWVRVRVEQEHWHDQSPVAPSAREAMFVQERKSPYSVTVRCSTAYIVIAADEWRLP